MAGSVIGALRVNLGLDSAQFETGLKQAQAGLGNFGRVAAAGFAAAAVAATAAGAALGVAIKRTINHADEISKTAQSVGLSVEALSRLEYAAKLSDVSLDQLSTGFKKLSQNMLQTAQGATNEAAKAFSALGISVRNADGTLRDSTALVGDIADSFAGLADGAAKTALAVALFGRSGADLIPLLNEGSAGIAQLADESDRLGLTLSTTSAQAAEAFNDSLTRLGAVWDGMVTQITQAILPGLANFSEKLVDAAFNSNILQGAAETLAIILKGVASTAIGVAAAVNTVTQSIRVLWEGINRRLAGESPESVAAFLGEGFTNVKEQVNEAIDLIGALWDETRSDASETYADQVASGLFRAVEGAKSATAAVKDLKVETTALADTSTQAGNALGDTLKTLARDALKGKLSINSLADAFDDLGSKAFDIGWNLLTSALTGGFGGGGFRLPGFANGVSNFPGGLAVVGERGPELVNLPRGSDVIPNGGFGVNNFYIDAKGAEIGVEQKIVAAISSLVPGMIKDGAPAAVAARADQDGEWRFK